jgi:hypothetical protein
MNILSSIGLLLLSMVGYSTGAMIVGKNKKVLPALSDIIVLVVMWGTALTTWGWIGNKWLGLGIWIILGFLTGSVAVGIRRYSFSIEKINKNPANLRNLKGFWEGWKAFGKRLGNYQSRILLALFYFPVVIPFGIIVRLFQDPFRRKVQQTESRWTPRSKSDHDLESIQRQF